jgi:hypothetical protein
MPIAVHPTAIRMARIQLLRRVREVVTPRMRPRTMAGRKIEGRKRWRP